MARKNILRIRKTEKEKRKSIVAFHEVLNYLTRAYLSQQLNVSPSAITVWARNGVPTEYGADIEKLVSRKVTKERLCPELTRVTLND